MQSYTEGAYKIYRNKNMNIQSEIPIFGSSRAAGSYIPDLLDTNCFNYGVEKTEHLLLELFLKNEYAKKKTTPIIINFDYDCWNDWLGDLSNYIPNLDDPQVENLFKKNDHWYFHVNGIRYYGYYQYYYKNFVGGRSKKNYIDKGGFFLLEKTPKSDLENEINARKTSPVQYFPNAKVEKEFLDLLGANNGRKIFVVLAPYHSSIMKNLYGKEFADQFFEKLKKVPNVYFFDYSDKIYPDSHFKNTTHLNYIGAKEFSSELKKKFHAITPEYFN
ncbi:MAG: hypothetical protein ACXVP4_04985 [Bacteroidia bacterium]